MMQDSNQRAMFAHANLHHFLIFKTTKDDIPRVKDFQRNWIKIVIYEIEFLGK